jgi:hypothetical protein
VRGSFIYQLFVVEWDGELVGNDSPQSPSAASKLAAYHYNDVLFFHHLTNFNAKIHNYIYIYKISSLILCFSLKISDVVSF